MKTTEAYIYCKNETKIEEILTYLFNQKIAFEIIGRQALFLPAIDEDKLEDFLKDPWFEVERKDNLEKFPPECWWVKRISRHAPFGGDVPDKFSPVKIPDQEKRKGAMGACHQADLDNLVALEFKNKEDFSKAVGIYVRELTRHQFFVPGRHTIIMDLKDKEYIIPFLKKAGLKFIERKVISGSQISKEKLSKLRRQNIFGEK
jgi:hypothetical protein